MITGGKYALLQSQVVDRLTGQANRSKLHLMPTSGTRYYRWDGRRWTLVFAHDLSDEERAKAKESLERNAREQGIWSDYAWGERIEDRGSQITFSALGQSAPIEAKEAWDPTDEKTQTGSCGCGRTAGIEVRPGGASSVDISQRGVDKSFAVRELADILGMEVGRIVFIGDRMEPGGNDYPAAMAGTRAVKVTGPADTVRLCDEIVACLSR